MNDEILLIALGLLVMFAAKELIATSIINHYRSKYKSVIKAEKTRAHFAELRGKLLDLAVKNKLNVKTQTFESLHLLYTIIMRRPEQYSAIAHVIFSAIVEREPQSQAHELDVDNEHVRELLLETVIGINVIIYNYSSFLKFVKFVSAVLHIKESKSIV